MDASLNWRSLSLQQEGEGMGQATRLLWLRRLPPEQRQEMVRMLRRICADCGESLGMTTRRLCATCDGGELLGGA